MYPVQERRQSNVGIVYVENNNMKVRLEIIEEVRQLCCVEGLWAIDRRAL